ncbi:hypothetical protein AB6A40_005108 [Gnathostoma spinigerum]|uniref:Uncharacterized protein n=1 Tax=Gnathostoma spinigerum TaxID=75299 RepID=A0ABD6EJS3_9BILA
MKKRRSSVKKTTVFKIPSLSRVNRSAQILVTVIGDEPLEVTVLDPTKNRIEAEISDHEFGVKKVEFTPQIVGDHEIDIKSGGSEVQGSPFTCRAYDPAKITVEKIPSGEIDKPVHFVGKIFAFRFPINFAGLISYRLVHYVFVHTPTELCTISNFRFTDIKLRDISFQ